MTFPAIDTNPWDLVLIIVVSVQSTWLAYLHHPKWKAFLLNLPLPFTIATLSVGRPIDATNITGLILLLIYAHWVRILNWRLKVPIVPAILIGALTYCLLGTLLAGVLPKTDATFWATGILVLALAVFFQLVLPHREERGHRSSLPAPIKLAAIVVVISCLVMTKQYLQGFMTVFPMVSLIACYEARHSLWTICRQMPIIMLTMLPMIIVMRLAQPWLGYAWALVPGWLVFLAVLIPMSLLHWKTVAAKTND